MYVKYIEKYYDFKNNINDYISLIYFTKLMMQYVISHVKCIIHDIHSQIHTHNMRLNYFIICIQ